MNLRKANVLIVDDRPDKVLSLEAVLDGLDQNVMCAYSGREALRHLLHHQFAVILLDINMPGMDGFETASLIRQRKSSEHVPIIFITAFGDEMHASRGYSLGAVDYILAPVIPDVLRTKVAVFVDLFNKTQQLQEQADWQRRRANQLQKLAAASVAINGAPSIEMMLQTITDTARDLVEGHQAITLFVQGAAPGRAERAVCVSSFSDRYAELRGRPLEVAALAGAVAALNRSAVRIPCDDLRRRPEWESLRLACPPLVAGGILAAPLIGRDGDNLGLIYLSDRQEGDFTSDDEAILVQLAQMASSAIENTLFAAVRQDNRAKDEFLATLSHELRTPLNAILGWTQLLAMEEVTGDVAHGLEVIDRNARAQAKLIEDLLDVSRITSGKLRIQIKKIAPIPVIRAAVDSCRPVSEAKQVPVDVDLEEDLPEINGDADRIQQVVWNLLSNAVKFTPPGGRVTLKVDADGQYVRIRVTDTGQGIDPAFIPFVFDRFRQADSTSTRAHGGLGIGLTIVRHIVELHGGTVTAASDGAGAGATFIVLLPIAAPASAPAHPANGDALSKVQSLSGTHVLLVDDEPDAREVVEQMLRRAGARVTSAGSADETLSVLPTLRPDVLISDIAMPIKDGYELIASIRRLGPDAGGEIPAIALTAYAGDGDRAKALAAGFQFHVSKPVEPSELFTAVNQTISMLTPHANA